MMAEARWLPPGPPTRVLQVRQVLPATVSQMASPVGPAFVSVPTAAKPPAATKGPVQIWPPVQAAEHPVEPEEAAEAPPMRSRFGGQQESDMLELMAQGPSSCDELTSQVPLISLGCNCGPKLSFQKIGRGSETLPFDWMQSSLDGILNFLRTDFGGFFDYVTKQKVPGCQAMVMYRGHLHSFWHDDPDDPTMQEKYRRRIKRLFGMGQLALPGGPPGHLLFVRAMASSEELPRAMELLGVLGALFGRQQVHLLLVLDFQNRFNGPALIAGSEPNLLVYFQSAEVHNAKLGPERSPYAAATQLALDWVVGRPIQAHLFPNLPSLCEQTNDTFWGYKGL
ncbi:unnamed protein product, partial [Polarella glacialis]